MAWQLRTSRVKNCSVNAKGVCDSLADVIDVLDGHAHAEEVGLPAQDWFNSLGGFTML